MTNEGNQFQVTAECLQATAGELGSKLRRAERKSRKVGRKIGGYLKSTAILQAFATECALKSLSKKRTNEYTRCHNLIALYDNLTGDVKKLVESIAATQDVLPPRKVLEKHGDDFIEWRYPIADDKVLSTNLVDMQNALNVLITALNHPRFRDLCP